MKYLFAGLLLTCTMTLQAQDYKEDLKPIEAALEANPNDEETLKPLLKAYKKEYKKSAEAITALGYSYFSVKDYANATAYADQAIAINQAYGDAYILKGDIAAMQDDGGGAAVMYQRAMINDPKNPNGYLSYANIYRKLNPAESEATINKLREMNPTFPVDAELGHMMYNANNTEKAYEYYSKANRDDLSEGRLAEFGLIAREMKKNEEALDIAKFGVQKFPESNAFLRLAMINAVGLEKYDEALSFIEKLIAKEGETNSGDLIYYGQALSGLGRHDEAIAKFHKAIEVDNKNFMPYQHISETYAKMGNEDKAIEFSQKYLDLNPNAKLSEYNKLAGIYMAKVKKGDNAEQNYAKAMQVYDNVAAKYPQVASWTMYQKANETFKAEMDSLALGLYLNIINTLENKADRDKDETNYLATAYRNAGYIYWATKNDLDTALPYFEKVLLYDPQNALANKAINAAKEKAEAEAAAAAAAAEGAEGAEGETEAAQ